MRLHTCFVFFFHAFIVFAVPQTTEVSIQVDYKKALKLGKQVLSASPSDLDSLFKVGDLSLYLEGRDAAKKVLLEGLKSKSLDEVTRRQIIEKLKNIQSVFLTDEGQTKFLQAVSFIEQKDCESALKLLEHADVVENSNFKILEAKIFCEKALKRFESMYESLKRLAQNYPYEMKQLQKLAEAHFYFGHFDKAKLTVQQMESTNVKNFELELLSALSKVETGQAKEALRELLKLAQKEKHPLFHPIIHFGIGRLLAEQADGNKKEARKQLKLFLSKISSFSRDWDPYRSHEKVIKTQELLNGLSTPPSSVS